MQSRFDSEDTDKGHEQSYLNELKDNIVWSEVSQSFVGQNIFVNAGRIDYDYDNLVLNLTENARYPNEFAGVVIQFPHGRKDGSEVRPHIHWMPTSAVMPNILIAYRKCNNGGVFSAWELKALTIADNKFTYSEGIQQITEFNLPSTYASDLMISSTVEVKIYRDSRNNSGLFAGSDAYAGSVGLKYYDIHFQLDQEGSQEEFKKLINI